MPSKVPQITLYTWSEGLFPRRITLYLFAKKISQEVFDSHVHTVEYIIDEAKQDFVPVYGTEPSPPRPEGSFPSLIIQPSANSAENIVIHESGSILEYFEEVFGSEGRPMAGTDTASRAHIRDLLRLIDECIMWALVWGRHSSRSAYRWSGLPTEKRNQVAAEDGHAQYEKRLTKLADWAFGEGEITQGSWLAGKGDGPTIADCALAAFVIYMDQAYSLNVLEGNARLEKWLELYKLHESWTEEPQVPQWLRQENDFEY